MADPSSSADDNDFPEEDDGGAESTVSMTSPTIDPAMPLPISVPPPAMQSGSGPQMPTAPAPFVPGGAAAFPVHGRPAPASQPSVATPFGGITPAAPPSQPKPLPAAGAPAPAVSPVPGASGASAPAGMKRPQTVIGLAPPPVGAPRPGSPGGGRVPLPSGRNAAPAPGPAGAPRPPVPAPSSSPGDKAPPSSARGVKPPAVPVAPPAPAKPPAAKDADATDEQVAMDDTPDSQREEMPTMAKSAEESLALFGLSSGLTDAARAAVAGRPGAPPPVPAAGRSPLGGPPPPPVVEPISPLSPDQQTGALTRVASAPGMASEALPVLHDRGEEEESTRAVSREEMLRGHDAVIIGEDGDSAQGEDATLAVAPGLNEANSQHLAALAATLTRDQAVAQGQLPAEEQGAFPPPFGHAPAPQQAPPQQGWQDPNAYAQQQQPQQWQEPSAHAQQQGWNGPPSYPMGSVGPVSGPHLPAANPFPPSGHMPVPQSSPQLAVPQSGHMPAGFASGQGPIPYPGQPNIHQPPPNPFGDWNAGGAPQKKFVLSGQILLLAIVGTVCLAIFITGIVLFATTKF